MVWYSRQRVHQFPGVENSAAPQGGDPKEWPPGHPGRAQGPCLPLAANSLVPWCNFTSFWVVALAQWATLLPPLLGPHLLTLSVVEGTG